MKHCSGVIVNDDVSNLALLTTQKLILMVRKSNLVQVILGVTGTGLTGGGETGTVTVNVVGGDGITEINDIQVDGTVLRTTGDGVVSGSIHSM